MLTYYLPKEKVRKVKNLLANKEEAQEPEPEPDQADEIVSHWHHVSCETIWQMKFYNPHPELDFGPGLRWR